MEPFNIYILTIIKRNINISKYKRSIIHNNNEIYIYSINTNNNK